MHYRFRDTFYHVEIRKKAGEAFKVVRVVLDGKEQPGAFIPLLDDRIEHRAVN